MPRLPSNAIHLNEATLRQKDRKWALPDKLSHSSQWNSFHRWPLAVRWLLRQWDGKIHVVPFEICSCVMPTRAEYCQSTKAITLLCPFSHTHIYTNMDTHIPLWLPSLALYLTVTSFRTLLSLKMNAKPREASPNAKLSCFIPYLTPHALYDWINLVKCHTASATIVVWTNL